MNRGIAILLTALIYFLGITSSRASELQGESEFTQILELAGIDQESLRQLGSTSDLDASNWQLINKIWFRFQQYPEKQLTAWALSANPQAWLKDSGNLIGGLFTIQGTVESWAVVPLPEDTESKETSPDLYRCTFQCVEPEFRGTLLTHQIPEAWRNSKFKKQPVQFLGVLLQIDGQKSDFDQVVMLTNRLAWYPQKGVPTGHQLLASLGMDIALLDEIAQYRPFVSPEVSRESDAFYSCLKAMANIDQAALIQACRDNVNRVAANWKNRQAEIEQTYENLKKQIGNSQSAQEKAALEKELISARQLRSVANAVQKQSQQGESSVGPLFLQPKKEVGELVQFTGLARRAVRIPVPEREDIDAYYEIEVFSAEAKYLEQRPLVCCVARLPKGFPTGDIIREPVSISGIFFKQWRYRSRNLRDSDGETNRPSQLYTPLIVSSMPTWIRDSKSNENSWGIWGGVAFLSLLALTWLYYLRGARLERQARQALQPTKIDEL